MALSGAPRHLVFYYVGSSMVERSHRSQRSSPTQQLTAHLRQRARAVVLASVLATGLLSGLRPIGLLQPLELMGFDLWQRQQADEPPDPRLVILGMTQADIQQYQWPLSDEQLAQVLAEVQQAQPRVIGLDLYRDRPNPPGSEALQAELARPNVITVMNVGIDPMLGEVPAPPGVPWARVGFNDLVLDPDWVLRRNLLFVRSPERHYYSFALRVALAYLTADPTASAQFEVDDTTLTLGQTQIPVLTQGFGAYQAIDERGYQILTRYRHGQSPAQHISIRQLLNGQVDPAMLRDRIVLVGTTASSLKDEFYTPYSLVRSSGFTMPGVVAHGQLVSHLLDIAAAEPVLFRGLPPWGKTLWLLGWAAIASSCVWGIRRPLQIGVAVLLMGGVLVGGVAIAFSQLLWLPLAEPLVAMGLASGLAVLHKLLYRSTHDSLTGLPNRVVFVEQVRRSLMASSASAGGDQVTAVAFLDIDRFRLINQSFGHSVGDRLLQTVTQRLLLHKPATAKLARVGGDEFALLLPAIRQGDLEQCLDQLQTALAEPVSVQQHRLGITASIGIALPQPGQESSPETLIRDAYTAMFRAKALGRSRYALFSSSMRVAAVHRLQLESDLPQALSQQDMVLHYQPIVCLQTGTISGFEALVRWRSPDRGIIPPSDFIPIAEETGFIVTLGQWVFQTACQQLKTWQQQFPDYALKMSINLSRRQFEQPDLEQHLADTLHQVDLPVNSVQLEITESTAMVDVEAAIHLMVRLKRLGVQFSIDDFGTGYSSLSYLHRLPVDALKIDKSFVSCMDHSSENQDIVQTIITLGHKLGIEVVAEGIENQTHLHLLNQSACEYGQGYFFSHPLPAEAATDLLTSLYPSGSMAAQPSS